MHEPTRFGDLLLLKKLSEDPLGGTYRAARVKGEALGDFVYVRIFNVPGIDASTLAASMAEYTASTGGLQGPGITHAVDSGEVSGVAYAAYAIFTGWDLTAILRKANAGFASLERDHALLIAERIAKGLDVVHQADVARMRPYHGFLTPQRVTLTSDGELKLTGFESGEYLAGLAPRGHLSDAILRYVSPEIRGGESPSARDDIYALGAILWELLMGSPPPLDLSSQLTAHLASAKLDSGEVLPAGLAELLQSSLAAVRVRTPNAGLWHKQLADWMTRRELKTTHFDLAFAVHELFRSELQIEQEEIEREKKIDLAQKPAREAAATVPAAVAAVEGTDVVAAPPPRAGRGKGVGLGIAAVVLVAIGVGVILMSGEPDEPAAPPQVAAPPPLVPPPPPERSEGLQLAELELERLVDERAEAMGDQIAAEYDEQIRSLQEQLREAQAVEEEAIRQVTAAPPVSPPPSAPEASPPPSTPPPSTPPPSRPPRTPPPVTPAPTTPAPTTPAPTRSSASAPEPEPAAPAPAQAAPPSPPPRQAAPPEPEKVPVVQTPRRVRIPNAVYPPRARQLRKEATVLLKVLVGTEGRVVEARPVVDREDRYGFTQSALRAVRNAVFEPGTTDGVATEMWTTVVVSFKM